MIISTILSPIRHVFSKRKSKNDFYAFFNQYLCERQSQLSHGTYNNYRSEISKMKKFRPGLTFRQIDRDLLDDYERYMLRVLGNDPNTVSKTIKCLKLVIRSAIQQKRMETDPFVNYRIRHKPTVRDFLTLEEIDRLENLYKSTPIPQLKNTLHGFLFGCYTGLRYSDIKQLKRSNIQNKLIVIRMTKTRDFVRVPLSHKAAALIENLPDDPLFRLLSPYRTNEYLSLACKQANISKKVTFHVSRHSFATLSLNMGIPLDALCSLLGHSDIKTTMIYAKMLDQTKVDLMKKWDYVQ